MLAETEGTLMVPFNVIASIVVLSILAYLFFDMTLGEPLDAAETTVVVAIMAAVVFVVRWLWKTLRKGRSPGHE